jgi:hypothetical protein
MRPDHHWMCEFGDAGNDTSCVKQFNLDTFQEWTPDVDTSRPPVAMVINSSELRGDGFKIKEVLSPVLEVPARGGIRTRGAGL